MIKTAATFFIMTTNAFALTVSWDAAKDATGYEVSVSETTAQRNPKSVTETKATIDIAQDKTQFLSVRALYKDGKSDWVPDIRYEKGVRLYGVAQGASFEVPLTPLTVRHGWWLDGVNGKGGSGGTEAKATDLKITRIAGTYGQNVSQLTATTLDGKTIGPFGQGKEPSGNPSPNKFEVVAPEGQYLAYVVGTAAGGLKSIGARAVPLTQEVKSPCQ